MSIVAVTSLSLFLIQDKLAHAVSIAENHVPQVEKPQNKTIAAAVDEYKKFGFEYAMTSFKYGNPDLNTKVLVIKENDGYGFLQGSAEHIDSNGNFVSNDNADTDPNAATVGDILAAIEKAHPEK